MSFEGQTQGGFMMLRLENFALGLLFPTARITQNTLRYHKTYFKVSTIPRQLSS